jgi:hypothetical protein
LLSQNGDHPLEDEEKVMIIPEKHLGESGYKPYTKLQNSNQPSIFLATQ